MPVARNVVSRRQWLLPVAAAAIGLFISYRRQRRRFLLSGKLAVITGGSRGLGLAIAEECVKAGIQVVICARDADELERARLQLLIQTNDQASVHTICCDVTDNEALARSFHSVSRNIGPIDLLINNAGVIMVGPFEDQSVANFEAAMKTNFFAALEAVKAVLPQMMQRRSGYIINIASIGGQVAVPHLLPYCASKFALVGFSRGLTAEVRSSGIRVLTVSPWLMRTGSHGKAFFTGNRLAEYTWFSLGATLPVVSVDASYAARLILKAVRAGRSELLISPWAVASSYFSHLAPSITNTLLSWVSRALPSGSSGRETALFEGRELRGDSSRGWQALGVSAETRWNQ